MAKLAVSEWRRPVADSTRLPVGIALLVMLGASALFWFVVIKIGLRFIG